MGLNTNSVPPALPPQRMPYRFTASHCPAFSATAPACACSGKRSTNFSAIATASGQAAEFLTYTTTVEAKPWLVDSPGRIFGDVGNGACIQFVDDLMAGADPASMTVVATEADLLGLALLLQERRLGHAVAPQPRRGCG